MERSTPHTNVAKHGMCKYIHIRVLTTFALLNHVHCLAGFEVDLRVLLSFVVGHSHILLQYHRLQAVNPWVEQTRRQPPACFDRRQTPAASNCIPASVDPVCCHQPTPALCHHVSSLAEHETNCRLYGIVPELQPYGWRAPWLTATHFRCIWRDQNNKN